MKRLRFLLLALGISAALVWGEGCSTTSHRAGTRTTIRYVGSSTVGLFLRDAAPIYGRAEFQIDTGPESEGGEKAILEGTTELAGIAIQPRPETLRAGIASILIGRDAIAVIVNTENPIRNLSSSDLQAIFSGEIRNWKRVGGNDLPIEPFIVGPDSATRQVFRTFGLGGEPYKGCQEIRPDRGILAAVQGAEGGVGHISFSFLKEAQGVRAVAIDGEEPSVTNFDYPIARPLYLLWRGGNRAVEDFVEWTQSGVGQRVVMQRFVGVHVVGPAREAAETRVTTGTLLVYTETYPVYDGGIYYYPHRPYQLLTRHGELIRRVQNHRGENDENPTRIRLAPGTYLVRPEVSRGAHSEFFVTIKAGQTTSVDVAELLGR